jgi:hypothetical protein
MSTGNSITSVKPSVGTKYQVANYNTTKNTDKVKKNRFNKVKKEGERLRKDCLVRYVSDKGVQGEHGVILGVISRSKGNVIYLVQYGTRISKTNKNNLLKI